MSQKSKIEWTERTWNPIRGCSKISPGCENCYAMHVAARFSGDRQPYQGLAKKHPVNWTGDVRLIEHVLYEPLGRRQPTMYFVNSMSDLFHEKVPDDWIYRILGVAALTPRHTYQILTKRAERMERQLSDIGMTTVECHVGEAAMHFGCGDPRRRPDWSWPLPNVWLGVSVENQEAAEARLDHLCRTPAAVRFASVEPLLGPVNLDRWLHPECEGFEDACCERRDCYCDTKPAIDWVIVGGESSQGGRCRPCRLDWIRSIVTQCQQTNVPVFVKQLGGRAVCGAADAEYRFAIKNRKGGDPEEWPEDLRVRQFPRIREEVSP